jgi:hypothetical protein
MASLKEKSKESAKEFKGAAQQKRLAVMKGVEDRYESAEDYTKQKSGEIAHSSKATKDSAVNSAVCVKDSVADTASHYVGAAQDKFAGLKDGVLNSFDQTEDSVDESAKNMKDAAADKYIQAADYTASATHDTASTISRKIGETLEGAEQTIRDYSDDAKDKAAGAWDATKQNGHCTE